MGRAVTAFNDMAEHLRRNRERLVYLTQMSSWETLARKTAHELKNSLTPIRLTVEEMVARQPSSDREFMQQAAQIVIGEIETLERRVRAFSEFASEPPVNPEALDINAIVQERLSLLKPVHPDTTYRCVLDGQSPYWDFQLEGTYKPQGPRGLYTYPPFLAAAFVPACAARPAGRPRPCR